MSSSCAGVSSPNDVVEPKLNPAINRNSPTTLGNRVKEGVLEITCMGVTSLGIPYMGFPAHIYPPRPNLASGFGTAHAKRQWRLDCGNAAATNAHTSRARHLSPAGGVRGRCRGQGGSEPDERRAAR